ncbi:MAG: radical SAM protein [Anaerolineae bacterium CG2_30_64_16]|nr:MAG: radical SAM protein [Anaerolineae bacterium CG2_30_64_16]
MDTTEIAAPSRPLIAFGPVPSRRLGRSIGINHIPPKTCSYACVYCQVGYTSRMRTARRAFYAEDDIVADVERKLTDAQAAGETVDYLTFVPDGEPTLDVGLGRVIERLKPLGVKIAVISNGSLLWRADVREALAGADWVSVKVDAMRPDVWRRINRPHRSLWLSIVLEGLLTFAEAYRGELATETMLVRGVNDDAAHLTDVASFLAQLQPAKAYLAVPTRPPAEPWAEPPPEAVINQAFQLLRARLEHVELLIGYEGNAFASTGNLADDLLSITAVHPMREDAVQELLARSGAEMSVVQALIAGGHLVETTYDGRKFYARKLKGVSVHG